MSRRICLIAYCGQPRKGWGLCDKHHQRLKRTGTTADWQQSLYDRFWSKVEKRGPDDCWLWTAATNEHGYGVMRPEGKRTGPTIKAHRVALQLAGVEIDGLLIRHACDNPPCVNPAHLSVGTHKDNSADMVARGRSPRGSRSGAAKLTEAQVVEIRTRYAAGERQRALAVEYGISRSHISYIVNGRGWTHVPMPERAA